MHVSPVDAPARRPDDERRSPTREKKARRLSIGPSSDLPSLDWHRPITPTNKQDGQFSDSNELRLSAYILIDGAPRLRM